MDRMDRRVAPRCLVAVAAVIAVGVSAAGCGGSSSGGGGSAPPQQGAPQQGAGSAATAYLSSQTFTSLLVEVDYVQGHAPDGQALALFEQRLNERLSKPAGITVQLDDAIASVSSAYSAADLRALETQHRDAVTQAPNATLYLLWVDGGSTQDDPNSSVLGLAYDEESLAFFEENIESAANVIVTPSEVQAAVLVHELGHALGLVNLGTPMVTPHEDPDHPGHDEDDACVMFWALETTNIRNIAMNQGTIPNQFCAEGIADMQAVGGK